MHHIFTMVPDDQEAQLYTQITCERCKASISKDSRSAAIAGWNRRLSYKRLKPEEVTDFIEACKPPSAERQREAEYRRIWIERACVAFDGDAPNANPTDSAVYAFDAADAFIAELRKRDQEGK